MFSIAHSFNHTVARVSAGFCMRRVSQFVHPPSTVVFSDGISKLVAKSLRVPHSISNPTTDVADLVCSGNIPSAKTFAEHHLSSHPEDFASIEFLFNLYRCLDSVNEMRDIVPRILWAWSHEHESFPSLLAFHASGLLASGDVVAAESVAMQALLIDASTPSAIRSVATSLHLQGRNREGKRFLRDMEDHWPSIDSDEARSADFLHPDSLDLFLLSAAMDLEQGKQQNVILHRVDRNIIGSIDFESSREHARTNFVAWKQDAVERIRVAVAVAARVQLTLPLAESSIDSGSEGRGDNSPTLFSKVFGSSQDSDVQARLDEVWKSICQKVMALEELAESTEFDLESNNQRFVRCKDNLVNSFAPAFVFEAHVLLAHAHADEIQAGERRLEQLKEIVAKSPRDTETYDTGLQLCRAMLISKREPQEAMTTLLNIRYRLDRLAVGVVTLDLIDQVSPQ